MVYDGINLLGFILFKLNLFSLYMYFIWLLYYNMNWYYCVWILEIFEIIIIYKNYLLLFILFCCCFFGFYDFETLTIFGFDFDGGQFCFFVRFIFDREYFSSGFNSCNDVVIVFFRIFIKLILFVRIIFLKILFLNLFINNL